MSDARLKNLLIEQAIAELQSGADDDERSFRLVFDFYYRPVNAFFRRRTFSAEEADDLTQETFLRVYTKIEQFRGDAPFEAWLWQIAANLFRKSRARGQTLKRAGETVSLDNDESDRADANLHDKTAANPLSEILRADQKNEMQEAIENLPEQMRKCIMLRVFQDLSYGEIALVMRLSPQTVKTHLFQARKQLRKRLGEYFENIKV